MSGPQRGCGDHQGHRTALRDQPVTISRYRTVTGAERCSAAAGVERPAPLRSVEQPPPSVFLALHLVRSWAYTEPPDIGRAHFVRTAVATPRAEHAESLTGSSGSHSTTFDQNCPSRTATCATANQTHPRPSDRMPTTTPGTCTARLGSSTPLWSTSSRQPI